MNTTPALTSWQKKQATLLYHFASLDSLKQMQLVLNDLISYVEQILDLAKNQDRDRHLTNQRWGNRDTAENWANNAWPFLKNFQLTTSRQIAERAMERFNISGLNQFERGVAEYSMNWATPDEEEEFQRIKIELNRHARRINMTLYKYTKISQWDDYGLSHEWDILKQEFPRIPKFRIRSDVRADTNQIPVRTGVYISENDINATLQFAWHGGAQGKILPGSTFNDLGQAALATVGRADLWIEQNKMLAFVLANKNNALLKNDPFYGESKTPELAPSLVSRNAFSPSEGKWLYVELVNGEFEDVNDVTTAATSSTGGPGIAGGET